MFDVVSDISAPPDCGCFGIEEYHIRDYGLALKIDVPDLATYDFYTLDLAGRNAREDCRRQIPLGTGSPVIDQDIPRGRRKAAGTISIIELEAGHLIDHVQRCVGLITFEERSWIFHGLGGILTHRCRQFLANLLFMLRCKPRGTQNARGQHDPT